MSTRSLRTDPDVERAVASWRRWKWLGLAVFTVAFTGAAGVAAFLPDIYAARATILIERPQVPDAFVRSAVTSDLATRLDTIREQVQSRARLWKVITTYNLYPEMRRSATQDAVVAQMRRDLSVDVRVPEHAHQPGSATAMTITYRGRNPDTVAAVANRLATEFVDENSRTRERVARGTSAFLRSQLEKVGAQLEQQEQRMTSYKRRHSGELPNSRESLLTGLMRLSTQLDRNLEMQSRARERLSQAERDLAMPALPPPLPDGTESDEARLARLRTELTELRQRYTEQYPDIAAVKAEIATLEQRIRARSPDSGGEFASPAIARATAQKQMYETELKSLREEERQLRPAIADVQARLERMPQRDLELEQMTRDYSSVREQYESLLGRYRDAALAEGVELREHGEEFSILDSAVPPASPSAPNRQRLLIMGVVFALGLAGLVMVGADRLDTTFHTVGELRTFTTVPVLATVPPIVTRGDKARGVLRAGLVAGTLVLAAAAALGGAWFVADDNDSLVRIVSSGGS
jgi:polysaccharide chain length determinant protein (PEP-CTERM system associated)